MGFYTIHPRDINMIQYRKNAVVVDIREPKEYQDYHYRRAVNRPYKEEDQWLSTFSKRRVYILYCEYGSTSLLAARRMGKAGYEVYTVIGGAHAMREYFND